MGSRETNNYPSFSAHIEQLSHYNADLIARSGKVENDSVANRN